MVASFLAGPISLLWLRMDLIVTGIKVNFPYGKLGVL